MMKIIIAPDSFKGSLPALSVCHAVAEGIKRVYPNALIISTPMADGGEGTVDAVLESMKGLKIQAEVNDPLMRQINTSYGWVEEKSLAIIEMAAASGLVLLSNKERNPLKASSFGTGQLIRHALDKGAKEILLCIGGSATNDAGAGMLQALGVKLLDKKIEELVFGGGELTKLEKVDITQIDKRIYQVKLYVACDVTNPLCGKYGASQVFGKQKGADTAQIRFLDQNLANFADISEKTLGHNIKNFRNYPGAGAAGGIGYALIAFLNAVLKNGIELVMELTHFEQIVKDAANTANTLIITGEGRIDAQTSFGKVPVGVAKIAKKYHLPVFAITGSIGEGAEKLYQMGIDSIFPIVNRPMKLEEAMSEAFDLVAETAERIFRIWKTQSDL